MQSDVPVMGFDAIDPEVTPGLTCHIEMNIVGGQTARDVATRVAVTLRDLAVQIEGGQLDTGFHRIAARDGADVGELYLDFHCEITF